MTRPKMPAHNIPSDKASSSKTQIEHLLNEISVGRKRLKNARTQIKPHKTTVSVKESVITEIKKREELCTSTPLPQNISVILNTLNRDRNDWKYMAEQPVLREGTTTKIIDIRKPALKKQHIKYVKYKDGISTESISNNELCAICLHKYTSINICGILRCNHFYHKKCINSHISTAGYCPICRRDVISGLINQ
ncbi:hypothetical protein NEIRO03_0381 [Nematocida sp. AWRm78]|nr:hypothetical protein NEIRO02_0375 [Nematocida sp. AWRm79]KAI5182730.1 hypothetical protein NEIRO03_0381 [Nematocida sp. AWRm78]